MAAIELIEMKCIIRLSFSAAAYFLLLLLSPHSRYRERAREMKAYAKEKDSAAELQRRHAFESLQNRFNDQLAMMGSAYRANSAREQQDDRDHVSKAEREKKEKEKEKEKRGKGI